LAQAHDHDCCWPGTKAFGRELGDVATGLAGVVENRIGDGSLTLWEVNNTPVALAPSAT
jgi:hypothetical protein